MADVDGPEAGEGVDVLVAVAVPDERALGALHDDRLEALHLREGGPEVVRHLGVERPLIRIVRHCLPSRLPCDRRRRSHRCGRPGSRLRRRCSTSPPARIARGLTLRSHTGSSQYIHLGGYAPAWRASGPSVAEFAGHVGSDPADARRAPPALSSASGRPRSARPAKSAPCAPLPWPPRRARRRPTGRRPGATRSTGVKCSPARSRRAVSFSFRKSPPMPTRSIMSSIISSRPVSTSPRTRRIIPTTSASSTICGRNSVLTESIMPTPPLSTSAPTPAVARPLSAFSYPACRPAYLASVARPGTAAGTPR